MGLCEPGGRGAIPIYMLVQTHSKPGGTVFLALQIMQRVLRDVVGQGGSWRLGERRGRERVAAPTENNSN